MTSCLPTRGHRSHQARHPRPPGARPGVPHQGRLQVTGRQVEPYLLFRGQEAWYLEAYCLLAQAQRTFKLERIRSARLTDLTYTPRPEVDLTSGRSGQAFIPGDVASLSTVRFEPRWLRHLEDRGVEFATLPDGRLEARIPYADEGWMAYDVLRLLGERRPGETALGPGEDQRTRGCASCPL